MTKRTMTWYIDANAKIRAEVYDGGSETWRVEEITVADALDAYTEDGCPAPADVEEVRHGEWISIDKWWKTVCSECKWGNWMGYIPTPQEAKERMPRCPNCGAKMDGGRDTHETI